MVKNMAEKLEIELNRKSKLYFYTYTELIDAIYNKAMNDKRYDNVVVVEKIHKLRKLFQDAEKKRKQQ